ncbi:phosphopantetheine-binding protein [Dictyobacter arantiisoli]|uniref:Carrier domain-containing protein n=1 Tax=Dictyobacter arantiisoli TaxID=2014874 RepID=A0A5A5T8G4_9CHLR|nr:phosphopantetheine-binding protein [Dictyobacter arantiisoli]GCF07269.1 hypothetical protein KDI_08330 [Dictyobacter arantiisoli]
MLRHLQTISHCHDTSNSPVLQQILIDLLCTELNTKDIQAQHNFFELGCKALNLHILQINLQKQLNYAIPVRAFYTYPTIEMLADHLATVTVSAQTTDKQA